MSLILYCVWCIVISNSRQQAVQRRAEGRKKKMHSDEVRVSDGGQREEPDEYLILISDYRISEETISSVDFICKINLFWVDIFCRNRKLTPKNKDFTRTPILNN